MGSGMGVTSKIEDFALKYAFLSFGSFFLLVRQFWTPFFEYNHVILVPNDREPSVTDIVVEFFLKKAPDFEKSEFFGRKLLIFYDF